MVRLHLSKQSTISHIPRKKKRSSISDEPNSDQNNLIASNLNNLQKGLASVLEQNLSLRQNSKPVITPERQDPVAGPVIQPNSARSFHYSSKSDPDVKFDKSVKNKEEKKCIF